MQIVELVMQPVERIVDICFGIVRMMKLRAEENAVDNVMGVAGLMDGTTPLQSLEFWYERNAGVRKQFLANLVGPVTRCRQIMNRRCVVDVVT